MAEQSARLHLETQGLVFIEANFRWRGGEIDLVMRAPCGSVVFVEVRSARSSSPWLRYSITSAKRRKLLNTAFQYLLRKPWTHQRSFRFDLVWVEGARFEHWPNVLMG